MSSSYKVSIIFYDRSGMDFVNVPNKTVEQLTEYYYDPAKSHWPIMFSSVAGPVVVFTKDIIEFDIMEEIGEYEFEGGRG